MVKIEVDPQEKFRKEFQKAAKKVPDLTIPLREITKRWYQSNKAIFALQGAGQYKDLSPRYKVQKQKEIGFIYPILKGKNQRIQKAITEPSDTNAYNYIANKKVLLLGVTKTDDFPYAAIHLYGGRNIPARPYLFSGAEQTAPDGIKKSVEIYLDILNSYVKQVMGKVAE